jgi:DNA-binding transcriptional MerR regulator
MFGVTRQRVRYWRKIGLLPPCVDGGKQGYSFQDVLRVKIVSTLVEAGIQPARIRKTLATLKLMFQKDDVLTGKSLYVYGKEIFIFQGGKAITPRTGQFLLFDVDDYQKQLKLEVRQILEQAQLDVQGWR